jgi:rubrerythrin
LAKNFKDLSEQEILALAISLEETHARVYADFAAGWKTDYPTTAQIIKDLETEEDAHRGKLIEECDPIVSQCAKDPAFVKSGAQVNCFSK